jgi:aryl-alcohol dehydrogenase-like predicted oxidoreductase
VPGTAGPIDSSTGASKGFADYRCGVIPSAPFGSTGHSSRRTIFGAAALGRVTEAEADRALELVLRYDLNHLDTAASYGDSELHIAPWLAREGRERFFLATKTGKRTYPEARDQIRESLRRLGVDHVDLIQLHNLVDQDEWNLAMGKDGALRAVVEARDAGLARFIGVTGHGLEVARRHRESLERFPFDSVLFPYNATQLKGEEYTRDVEALIALCEKRGVAMQTIKAITLGPWHGERPPRPTTWYEPLTDQHDIDLTVRFILAREGLFLNTASDIGLLEKILDAADRGGPAPTSEELEDLIRRREMAPLFA